MYFKIHNKVSENVLYNVETLCWICCEHSFYSFLSFFSFLLSFLKKLCCGSNKEIFKWVLLIKWCVKICGLINKQSLFDLEDIHLSDKLPTPWKLVQMPPSGIPTQRSLILQHVHFLHWDFNNPHCNWKF